jgi:hypothetical protein
MLKTVSSITNALGALNFKGTWDANANSPALASSVGTKGDYYVVGTAGTTNLNGVSNWGVGDWATFNGSVWQRVEGGADLNGVNLSVSGTSTLSALTASTALALNASKEIVSVTNTGTGNNVLATAPTLVGDVTLSTGNLVVSNGKGIDFSLTPGTGTSELFADYEEGTWTPSLGGDTTYLTQIGRYTKVGRLVTFTGTLYVNAIGTGSATTISGLPFTVSQRSAMCFGEIGGAATSVSSLYGLINSGATTISIRGITVAAASNASITAFQNQTYIDFSGQYTV